MKKEITTFVIVIIAYSLVAFAYVHDKFISKDMLSFLCDRLDRIELKLDAILQSRRSSK